MIDQRVSREIVRARGRASRWNALYLVLLSTALVYTVVGKVLSYLLNLPLILSSPRIVVICLVGCAILKFLATGKGRLLGVPLSLVVLTYCFASWLLLASLFAQTREFNVGRVFDGFYFLSILTSVAFLTSNPDDGQASIRRLLVYMLRSSVVAVLLVCTFIGFLVGPANVLRPGYLRWYLASQLQPLQFGVNYVGFSLVVLTVFPMMVAVGLVQSSLVRRLACSAIVAVVVGFTLLLGSRQSVTAMVLMFMLMAVMSIVFGQSGRTWRTLRLVVVGLLLAMILTAVSETPTGNWIADRLIDTSSHEVREAGGRLALYKTALEMTMENPFVGHGPNSFEELTGRDPHNTWLLYGTDAGLPAVVLLFAVFFTIVSRGFLAAVRLRHLGFIQEAMIVGGLASSCAVIAFWSTQFNILQYRVEMWLLLGILSAWSQLSRV